MTPSDLRRGMNVVGRKIEFLYRRILLSIRVDQDQMPFYYYP